MKIRINDEFISGKFRFRIRLDFRAEEKSGRFIFGGKTNKNMAESLREQQMGLMKNVPLQGIRFEDFDVSMDSFVVIEGENRKKQEVAYAPLIITVRAESIEDVFPLLIRSELKKIEVLSPENVNIERNELERLFYSIFKISKNLSS